jgi:predicted SnoaL-like aldol condensation-catalyzing enzyme
MSAEKNKELVQQLFEQGYRQAWQGNVNVLDQYFADNYYDHMPLHAQESGIKGLKEAIADSAQAAPNTRWKIMHMAAEGDLVFAHLQILFTHEKEFQTTRFLRREEPRGQEHTVESIALFRIENGRIAERWLYHNLADSVRRRGGTLGPLPNES